jgi:hypothetical protein
MFCQRERLASQKILVRAVPDKGTIKSGENFIRSAVDSKEALAPGKFLQIPEQIVSDGSRINFPFMIARPIGKFHLQGGRNLRRSTKLVIRHK